jgi:hypothetical protein
MEEEDDPNHFNEKPPSTEKKSSDITKVTAVEKILTMVSNGVSN